MLVSRVPVVKMVFAGGVVVVTTLTVSSSGMRICGGEKNQKSQNGSDKKSQGTQNTTSFDMSVPHAEKGGKRTRSNTDNTDREE